MNRATLKKWEKALIKIVKLHSRIKHIDKALEQLHPIAIVENNIFYVFDYDAPSDKYSFIMEYSIPGFEIPDKVLASFPLDFYDTKPAAVVSEDAIYELEKQVFIFHEFIHCYQYLNGETDIKTTLNIYKKYLNENNQMWEINHTFPYDDKDFAEKAVELTKHYEEKENRKILDFYEYMKTNLSIIDYEYLIWQEFKEGYARYIENTIRAFLGLALNDTAPQLPIERPIFYWTGSKHIDFILNTQGKTFKSLGELFELLF